MAKLCHTHVAGSRCITSTDEPFVSLHKGEYMTNKPSTVGQLPVPNDHTLVMITLTVAVQTFICDDHAEQAHDSAIDQIINLFTHDHEMTVLGWNSQPLTLIAGA
jgi:hypothetical protein